MASVLDEIVAYKRTTIERLKSAEDFDIADDYKARLDALIETAGLMTPPKSLFDALKGDKAETRIIAEVKKASPSKGVIREDFNPYDIAVEYERCGAAALSVLTEEKYFQGSIKNLVLATSNVDIPVLRKDFIVDEYQVYESRAVNADSLLLIAGVLDDEKLSELLELSRSLGMEPLVEVHSEEEMERTLKVGARIIGINNRNLNTFKTDMKTTVRLAKMVPDDLVVVSESGINTAEDIIGLKEAGASAFLIGESLMREADYGAKLRELITGSRLEREAD